jgi:phosphate-selective porin
LRIRASGKLVKTLSFFVQLDAASNPALKDARLRIACPKLPLTFEMGRFLPIFGVEGGVNPYWLTAVDYSLPVIKMFPGLWDVGAKVYGKTPINEQVGLNYAAAVVNGNASYSDNNKKKDFVGRLGVTLPAGVAVGGSAYIGKAAPADGVGDDLDKNRFGADVKVVNGPLLLQAEGILGKNGETDALGYYALLGFKVTPKLQAVVRFDSLDPNTDGEDDSTTRIRGGINHLIAGNNQCQLFYELSNLPDGTTGHKIIAQLAMIFETP